MHWFPRKIPSPSVESLLARRDGITLEVILQVTLPLLAPVVPDLLAE